MKKINKLRGRKLAPSGKVRKQLLNDKWIADNINQLNRKLDEVIDRLNWHISLKVSK